MTAAESSSSRSVLEPVVEAVLASLPPAASQAVQVGAVPVWVDPTLLRRMTSTGTDLDEIRGMLLRYGFAEEGPLGRLIYTDSVREILVERLRSQSPQAYRQANGAAMAYFARLAAEAPPAEQPALQRAWIYHGLIVAEQPTLLQVNEMLEEAIYSDQPTLFRRKAAQEEGREETIYYHQLGRVYRLVERITPLESQLSDRGAQWLRYFRACIELIYFKGDLGEATFQRLRLEAEDQVLRGLAAWRLGHVEGIHERLSAAIRLYRESLSLLDGPQAAHFRARVMLSIGMAYDALAEESGGLGSGPREASSAVSRVLVFLQNLPFLLLEWLVQRIPSLPNLYFGANYQDWIIDYLLLRAAGWFRRAEKLFADRPDAVELTECRLALARVEHQVGRWARAQRRYALLRRDPLVRESRYRSARVLQGMGRANLAEGKAQEALACLRQAEEVFDDFEDWASLGSTHSLLGQVQARLGNTAEAANSLLKSAEAFQQAGDRLGYTRSIWRLEQLNERARLPEPVRSRVEAVTGQVDERQSLGRFPRRLLALFRRMALFLALPLSYAVSALIGLLLIYVIFTFEDALQAQVRGPLFNYIVALLLVPLPFLVTFWIYRFIYSLTGVATVYIIGRKLDPIEREQPVSLVLDAEGVSLNYYSGSSPAERAAWPDITGCVSVDYMLWRKPIHLISRTLLLASQPVLDSLPGQRVLLVEGITTGYDLLKRDIQRKLASRPIPPRILNRDFIFFDNRWTPAVCLLLLLTYTLLYRMIKPVPVSPNSAEINLLSLGFTSVILIFSSSLLLVYPAVTLWRLYAHRLSLERETGQRSSFVSKGVLVVSALSFSLLSTGWVGLIVSWLVSKI